MEETELTGEALKRLQPDDYQIIDVRDEDAFAYGHIP